MSKLPEVDAWFNAHAVGFLNRLKKTIRLSEGAVTAELDQVFPEKKLRAEYDTRPLLDEEPTTGTEPSE